MLGLQFAGEHMFVFMWIIFAVLGLISILVLSTVILYLFCTKVGTTTHFNNKVMLVVFVGICIFAVVSKWIEESHKTQNISHYFFTNSSPPNKTTFGSGWMNNQSINSMILQSRMKHGRDSRIYQQRNYLTSANNPWSSISSVDANCPKFVVVTMGIEGLGDVLSRILMGAAIAYQSKITLAFKEFTHHSRHHKAGYLKIFEYELGIPLHFFFNLDDLIGRHNLTVENDFRADEAIYNPEFASTFPCNSARHLEDLIFCTAGNKTMAWCFSYIASTVQTIIRPLLDQSVSTMASRYIKLQSPIRQRLINIVWHVRTGDVCLKCDDPTFFANVNAFIEGAIGGVAQRQNIVVYNSDPRVQALFNGIPKVVHCADVDISVAVRLFRQADVLVTTGSSFPELVAMFTPLYRPVVLQSMDKDADPKVEQSSEGALARDKYMLPEGRAIRLDDAGNAIMFQPSDLRFILTHNGALRRVGEQKLR